MSTQAFLRAFSAFELARPPAVMASTDALELKVASLEARLKARELEATVASLEKRLAGPSGENKQETNDRAHEAMREAVRAFDHQLRIFGTFGAVLQISALLLSLAIALSSALLDEASARVSATVLAAVSSFSLGVDVTCGISKQAAYADKSSRTLSSILKKCEGGTLDATVVQTELDHALLQPEPSLLARACGCCSVSNSRVAARDLPR